MFFGSVNEATARVLAAEGCEVVVPQTQGCCGALAEHAGEEEDAMAAARKLIDAFEDADADTIVINAAGCGSAMKRYGHLLRNDPAYAAKAEAFAAKCKDISEVLAELEPRAPRGAVQLKAAYHDACHLQHAQGVRAQPRRLLQAIPGVTVREIAESEICCGSAGIYNLLEPDAATRAARSQSAEHPQDRRGGDRVGQPRLPASNRHRPRGRGHGRCASCTSSKFSISPSVRVSEPTSLIAAAGIATAAAWAYTISTASTMSSSMPMPGGWSMSMAWMSMGHQSPIAHATMFLVMWTVMMIAMMLPSVMPAVLLHRRLVGARVERGERAAGSHLLLLAGYFSVWVAFGAVAYAIGMTLAAAAMRSIRVSVLVPAATGVALAAAGRVSVDAMEAAVPAPLPLAARLLRAA